MSEPLFNFADKIVLITGGAGGIGRAAAIAFARGGAKVAIADVMTSAGEETVAALARAGGQGRFFKADVTRAAEVEALIGSVVETYGRLDYAFNNAGIEIEAAPTADCEEEQWDRVVNINLKGVWLCMKYELRQMLAQGGGAIVNNASVAGLKGAPTMPAYAASKHGVVGLTKSAAIEYGKAGIRVNAVCPAVIRTEMYERAVEREPKRKARTEKMHPIGRIGEADEVAQAVVWLCSDQSSFITGHALAVDGGYGA